MKDFEVKTLSQNDLEFENINPYVKFIVPVVNDSRNMLYARNLLKIFSDTAAPMRIQETLRLKRTSMLIASSGSGKTATCIEIARKQKTIYVDSNADLDFLVLLRKIKTDERKYDNSDDLQSMCSSYYCTFLLVRDHMLQTLLSRRICARLNEAQKNWKWVSYQRSLSFQNASASILTRLIDKYQLILNLTPLSNSQVVIIDEAHCLLGLLKDRFLSQSGKDKRPLLSVVVQINYLVARRAVYAGTLLSMGDESLIVSGAGGGKDDVYVCTDFDFYTEEVIRRLLGKVLTAEAFAYLEEDEATLTKCCYYLRGRVRFFSVFIQKLANYKNLSPISTATKKEQFLKDFNYVLDDYFISMTTRVPSPMNKNSLYTFWMRNFNSKAGPLMDKMSLGVRVNSCLLECLINYFVKDGDTNIITSDLDLVDTAIIRLHNISGSKYEYSMSEIIPLQAGLNYLRDGNKLDLLCVHILDQMRADQEQQFGNLFDLLMAIRMMHGWWLNIPEDDELLNSFGLKEKFMALKPPKGIIKQRSEYPIDWCLFNYLGQSDYYILPDTNLGPDGNYDFMCFNLKTYIIPGR